MNEHGSGELQGRVALVTGAGAGLGRAIALLFARAGADLIVTDIDGAGLATTAAQIEGEGGSVTAFACDMADRRDGTRATQAALQTGGRLDILVHNAGIFPLGKLAEIDEEAIERTLAINLGACFWLAKTALSFLRASGAGRILFTSSVAGNRSGLAGLIHYGASKAGVNGFIRGAAVEFGPFGITVNGVEPGLTRTERYALPDEATAQIVATVPLGRLGVPGDIAEAMLFLASDRAQWITGQTIVVDGGGSLPHPSSFTELAAPQPAQA